jgi:hypothetical protein
MFIEVVFFFLSFCLSCNYVMCAFYLFMLFLQL